MLLLLRAFFFLVDVDVVVLVEDPAVACSC